MQVVETAKNAITEPIHWVRRYPLAAFVLVAVVLILAIRSSDSLKAKVAQGQKNGSTVHGILGKLFGVTAAA